MRLFIEYTREDRVRYISHLDLMKSMQRTIRRARIPVAYSKGFNPQSRISFALPLSVGVTSSAEYMEIYLEKPVDIGGLLKDFSSQLPRGIRVLAACEVDRSIPSLMSLVERADYRVRMSIDIPDLEKSIKEFMKQEKILYDKTSKKGIRQVDLKKGIFDIGLDDSLNRDIILSLKAGSSGNVKPEAVLDKLLHFIGKDQEDIRLDIHRTGIYLMHEGKWQSPLALGEV